MSAAATGLAEQFFARGWVALPHDSVLAEWAEAALPMAEALTNDAALKEAWLRCGGTWFAGVNVFPNDSTGAVLEAGIPPLAGQAVAFIAEALGLYGFAWDKAQISVCYPGYPQPWEGESEANLRYRRTRDAAHVDGILRDEARRRSLGEPHGFVLGIPLGQAHADASPLVVWEGSHERIRSAFRTRFAGIAARDWHKEDITEAYQTARREVFESCERVVVHAAPGEAYVVHRLALHGVAPWTAPDGPPRVIAYFRPDPFPREAPDWWLECA